MLFFVEIFENIKCIVDLKFNRQLAFLPFQCFSYGSSIVGGMLKPCCLLQPNSVPNPMKQPKCAVMSNKYRSFPPVPLRENSITKSHKRTQYVVVCEKALP